MDEGSQGKRETLTEEFEKFTSDKCREDKLSAAVSFMKKALSHEGTPDFKGFWDVRKLCLDIFKEEINPVVREKYWIDFVDLSNEAKKLKDILEHKSVFLFEQMELAVNSLAKEIENIDSTVAIVDDSGFPEFGEFLAPKYGEYNDLQKKLNLLNAFAERINSFRKEIIKTDMRLRFKSKLLKSLSACGDKVFPIRRELIKEISAKFEQDVNAFFKLYFEKENSETPFYILKKEIKALQGAAKVLTLHVKSFTDTRMQLSFCWDKIKEIEEEKKQGSVEKRKELKDNYELLNKKIEGLEEIFKGDVSLKEADVVFDKMSKEIMEVNVLKADLHRLKKNLKEIFKPIEERKITERLEAQKKREELFKQKTEKLVEIKELTAKLIKEEGEYSFDDFNEARTGMLKELENLELNKIERQQIDRILKPLKDIIVNKKEKMQLNLSQDSLLALEKMKEIRKDRLKRKIEIKKQIDQYKEKAFGSSGFGFEEAMMYQDAISAEKKRLDNINELIGEIEEKIAEKES